MATASLSRQNDTVAECPPAPQAPRLASGEARAWLTRLIRILKRESPLGVAREALWRARRNWNRKRLPHRLGRLRAVEFRALPYYKPDLRSLSEEGGTIIVSFADEILAGRFRFFGYGTAELGAHPKWNFDFTSRAEWPSIPLENSQCIRFDGPDVKVPHELSRLQFLPVLGKAHILTGREIYRQKAKSLLSHWIESNPVGVGVNWTLAMEAALRAMSVCFLLNLLSPLRSDEQSWLAVVTRSLAQHLLFIEANLEFSYFLSSNHYLSNLVALYCLSLFLTRQDMAARRRKYRERIELEMTRQVYDDGADYEASTGYHVLVTQLFTTTLLLMRAERFPEPSPPFVERLRKMFRVLRTVAGISGGLPHVGDCDDGRTEFLIDDLEQMLTLPVRERNSLRVPHLLGLGQRLFGEGNGPGNDAAWYGLTACDTVPYSEVSGSPELGPVTVLHNSGIGVLRHGAAELLFFAIPNGISGKGSHTHNDKLSFVLRIAGQEVFCDSGTGCYSRDVATRNRLRSTAAHNTLMIDGLEQNRIVPGPRGIYIIGNEAAVSSIEGGSDPEGTFLRASHTGYRSLGVTHTRTVHALCGEPSFLIEDELQGSGVHDIEFNLQLVPERSAEVSARENGILCRIPGSPPVSVTVSGPAGLQGSTQPSLISTTYGATAPAMKVRFRGRAALPARLQTCIRWASVSGRTLNQSSIAKRELSAR
jgi:hypothetical protein